MNGREIDLEALFERDADSRLLERRRRDELGLPAPPPLAIVAPVGLPREPIAPPETPAGERAALRVALDARPVAGLIAGTGVSVGVAISNDGDEPVTAAVMRLALPAAAEPIAGSFARDGVPLREGLSPEGELRLGAIAARGTVEIEFRIRVLAGSAPLDLAVYAHAPGIPAIGPPALRLERRPQPIAVAPPRPLHEHAAHTPDHVLRRPWEPSEADALERVFSGATPHGLAALVLLSSIAAVDGALGEALGLARFARTVAAALPRAIVAARSGGPVPAVLTPECVAAVVPDAPAPPPEPLPAGSFLLARLDDAELALLRGVLRRPLADPFLRGVHLLVAAAPRALHGAHEHAQARVAEALGAYRVAAAAWLMRITVRRAVNRRFDPLTAADAALHGAGCDLVDALGAAAA